MSTSAPTPSPLPRSPGSVTVGIVTWNSAEVIERCLDSVRAQSWPTITLRVGDNSSADDTRARVAAKTTAEERLEFDKNLGFSGGHNRLIAASTTEFYLALNPDIDLSPGFVETLVRALQADASAGAATGKLLRFGPGSGPAQGAGPGPGSGSGSGSAGATGAGSSSLVAGREPDIIDSTGIIMQPSQRHLDRGADTVDDGRYARQEYVFGASGAAAMYRRAMLDDVVLAGEWFDEDFFAYREDADLAWRAQLYGWNCLYVPAAVARHGRRVTPERRADLPALVNYYSVRNRFLLRIKNQTAGHALRFLPAALARDLQVVGYVLVAERASRPALADVWRLWPRTWRKRRAIMAARRRSTREIIRWFQEESQPQSRILAGWDRHR